MKKNILYHEIMSLNIKSMYIYLIFFDCSIVQIILKNFECRMSFTLFGIELV